MPKPQAHVSERRVMDKEPETEHEESVTVNFKSQTEPGKTYSGNKMSDDALCGVCQKRFNDHSIEDLHECGRKQQNAGIKF
jgi:hypothetical protein